MIRDDVCYLIKETPGAHGVFDRPETTERAVMCAVKTVSSADYWRAYEHGIELTLVFVLSDFHDYEGEKHVRYGEGADARYYEIVRTYSADNSIELTCTEAKNYVG